MITDFDDLFPYIGGFGKFQWRVLLAVCYNTYLLCLCFYGSIFLLLTPPHWCKSSSSVEELYLQGFNITEDELVNLTIPTSSKGNGYQSCSKYDIDVTEVLNHGITSPDSSWDVVRCDNGWNYNFTSYYYPTFTSDFNLVCRDDWKPAFAQSIFFVGGIIGGPLFGWVADNYGRLPVIVSSNVITGVCGLWSAFATDYISFCLSRFLIGITHPANYVTLYIVAQELVEEKYRSLFANIPLITCLNWGLLSLPWISVGIGNWRMLAIFLAAPHLLYLLFPAFYPESLRWLIERGKHEKASQVIEKIARINGKTLPPEFQSKFQAFFEKGKETPPKIVSWWDLLKTPTLRKRFLLLCVMWVSVIISYDGDIRNVETLGGNFFVMFTIITAIECPADMVNFYLVEKIGRRYTVVGTLFLAAVTSFIVAFLPESNYTGILITVIIGRLFITMAANVGQQIIVEVLPTVARAQGSGLVTTLGTSLTLVTPYFVFMSKYYYWGPYTMIGAISLFGAICSMFLPETKGETLPGSLEEAEISFKEQKFIYNPFSKEFRRKGKIQPVEKS